MAPEMDREIEMTNERFFKLLTIALLGCASLAFVPEIKADVAGEAALLSSLPELESLDEVEAINSGLYPSHLQPYILEADSTAVAGMSGFDPAQ